MKTEIKKYLFDIDNSIASIFEFLGSERDFIQYQNNKLIKRAVERELVIIGEAINRILKIDAEIPIEHARRLWMREIGSSMLTIVLMTELFGE